MKKKIVSLLVAASMMSTMFAGTAMAEGAKAGVVWYNFCLLYTSVVIALFCIVPMVAWIATLIAMKGYSLTGEKMKEIQAVNAARKAAIAQGKTMEEAMAMYQTMDQVPKEFR